MPQVRAPNATVPTIASVRVSIATTVPPRPVQKEIRRKSAQSWHSVHVIS